MDFGGFMKRLMKKIAFVLLANLWLSWAQNLEGFEFVNQDAGEVFYAISLYSGKSIIADDTVTGNVTFRFAGKDFETAFDSFLKAERLFVKKENDVWTVSKVNFERVDESKMRLEALDVKASRLAERISKEFGVEVSWDILPENGISVRLEGSKAEDFLKALVRQVGKNYELESDGKVFRISKIGQTQQSRAVENLGKVQVSGDGEFYSVAAKDSAASALLEDLFVKAKKEYVFLSDVSFKIKSVNFQNKSLEESLNLICGAASCKWILYEDIYYVSSATASNAQIGKSWQKYVMKYLHCDDAVLLVESVFGRLNFVKLPDEMSFMCYATACGHEEIKKFVEEIDVEKKYHMVELKYISAQDFLSHLPPGIKTGQFKQTSSDNKLFFTGSDAEAQYLKTSLLNIDLPVKRISYDLLVLQYQYSNEENWESALSASSAALDDGSQVAVALGSVLSLKVDVLSTFGYKFASSLQTAINENKAQVFADTSLSGVSGGTIKFQNTNTYRYRDNNLDPETGEPIYSGVTREISSGLEIEVKGWVSGDGMITSSISASVSRQGTDTSASTGNPPPTSEKIITTEVRGKSGEVIVLSGLVQDEVSFEESGIPLLSKIPLLGWLFKARKKSNQKTEIVIYLVPHWQKDDSNESCESDEDFYERILMECLPLEGGLDGSFESEIKSE